MRSRLLFIGGTASHSGKSWFTTAICRHLRNRGILVAPFKAQNMSNNSCVAADGGEIGRAQAAQAEACGLEPVTDMNPILLKPHSDAGSQVIVRGRVWRDLSASAYYEQFEYLLGEVLASFERLTQKFEFIVVEGAGSVAEINLQSRDLVNFGFARRVGAPAMLVSDIDRGGVFASLIGTMGLLEEPDRQLVRSFAVNKFRGDRELFSDGAQFLEKRMERRCMGVFPYAPDIRLAAEDGVSLDELEAVESNIAAVRLPRISNFTDLNGLRVRWVGAPDSRLYSHVILPGTKNTAGDLSWLRECGLDRWILRQHAAGAQVIGVCGGYQMLGESVDGVAGLGLLPVRTTMQPEKTVQRVRAKTLAGHEFEAYEIHMGVTEADGCEPFAYIGGRCEGARSARCIGTYLHGALEDDGVCGELGLRHERTEPPYDALAQWFEQNANMRLFEELYL
jgi:adenosylcobyric acid synthase